MSDLSPSPPTPEYHGAGMGRRLMIWRPAMSGPNSAGGMHTVVARSRDLARNNTWAGSALDRSVSNAIGTGIQAKPMFGSKTSRNRAKKLWSRWCKVADADGGAGFEALQALAWREWKEVGEVFIRFRSRLAGDGLPVPLQIQLIESEQCPREYWATAPNGNPIRAGIEFNAFGRRVAYWMYRAHPGDLNLGTIDGAQLVRVPAEQVQHLYRPSRAGQLRGIPGLAALLVPTYKLERISDNVMERQQIANLFAGYYTREAGEDIATPGPLGENVDAKAGDDDDEAPIAGLEPGTMQELPPGVKPVFTEPPGAGTDYPEFIRTHLMAFAARFGVPYEVLTGDVRNVSDRALKLMLSEFRRLIESDQWLYFIPKFCQTVREAWFDAAILAGELVVPGYADMRDDVIETLWVPQGWPYSHPVQDVDADLKAIGGGLTTWSRTHLAAGDDPDEVFEEYAADVKRIDDLGLHLTSDARKGAKASAPAPAKPANTDDAERDDDGSDTPKDD